MTTRSLLLLSMLASPALGSWLSLGDPVPRTTQPPVLFLTGHDPVCSSPEAGETPPFSLTFGKADEILAATSRVSIHFDPCSVPGRPNIEELANAMGQRLQALRYTDGTPVPQVDVVAHSMGGLILRSYLAGKQTPPGVFRPPADPKVRRIVFLGTMHFGTPVAFPGNPDPQLDEISLGSQSLFDLNTWNQDTDDLRGIPALALIGDAGLIVPDRFSDSVVTLTSASINFLGPGHTRVLPMCHTYGGIGRLFLCEGPSLGLAFLDNAQHPSAQAILSFLDGTNTWQSIGQAAEDNAVLSRNAGLYVRLRDADNQTLPISEAQALTGDVPTLTLTVVGGTRAYADRVSTSPGRLIVRNGTRTLETPIRLVSGSSRVLSVKPGPVITRVQAAAGPLPLLIVSPGMLISIYGQQLAPSTAGVNSLQWPLTLADTEVRVRRADNTEAVLPLQYAGPTQINALLPDSLSGLVQLQVRQPAGSYSVNVLVEPSAPALFLTGVDQAAALVGGTGTTVSAASPIQRGQIVSLFLTGLGATSSQNGLDVATQTPVVTVGGQPCTVLFAGRAPGTRGVDQINCRLADNLPADPRALVVVTSGQRSSLPLTLPVR